MLHFPGALGTRLLMCRESGDDEVYSDSGDDEDDQEQVHEEELRATWDE